MKEIQIKKTNHSGRAQILKKKDQIPSLIEMGKLINSDGKLKR